MRTIVDLTKAQIERLQQVATRERISRAEAVRRAVDIAYPVQREGSTRSEQRRRAFGLWRGRGITSAEYLDALRGEWSSSPSGDAAP